MNIIIPIGGIGQRFQDEGYLMPKPLISILGKTMIYRVIDNLNLNEEDTIYIVYNSQLKEFNFENLVKFYFNITSFILVEGSPLPEGRLYFFSTLTLSLK